MFVFLTGKKEQHKNTVIFLNDVNLTFLFLYLQEAAVAESPKKEEPAGRPPSKSISMFDDSNADKDDDDLFGASGKPAPPPVTQVHWGKDEVKIKGITRKSPISAALFNIT